MRWIVCCLVAVFAGLVPGPIQGQESNATQADVETTAYELDLVGGWPTLRSLNSSAWNGTKTYRVTYAAGYDSIPSPLQVAVFELAAMHFENREAATPVQMHALPFSINSILQGYGPRET